MQTEVFGGCDENIRIRFAFQTQFDRDFAVHSCFEELFEIGQFKNQLAVAAR